LHKFDLVLTTYETVASEYIPPEDDKAKKKKKKKRVSQLAADSRLFDLNWKRIVLDEAHNIRNRSTGKFKAAVALKADCRWCLSGTPLVNAPEDIQALFQFLKLPPLDKFEIWNRSIGRPIKSGDALGLDRLRAFFSSLCLRRTKDLLKDRLPSKTVEMETIELGKHERDVYDVLLKTGRLLFHSLLNISAREALKNYSHILECLTRLRQACCSPTLIPPERIAAARRVLKIYAEYVDQGDDVKLTSKQVQELILKLQGVLDADEECCVCMEPKDALMCVLRKCKHCVCEPCLEKIIETKRGAQPSCPMCREPFQKQDILKLDDLAKAEEEAKAKREAEGKNESEEEEEEDMESIDPASYLPAKIPALLGSLKNALAENPEEKFVVFSQFTSYIDIVKEVLEEELPEVTLLELRGSMSSKQRRYALNTFKEERGPMVFLVSLRAGGVGINLTSSCKAFMLDLWWNPAVEEQAMDRVHRIGQKRAVNIVRYYVANSVEERILKLQADKKLFSKGAMQKVDPEEVRKVRLGILTELFKLH